MSPLKSQKPTVVFTKFLTLIFFSFFWLRIFDITQFSFRFSDNDGWSIEVICSLVPYKHGQRQIQKFPSISLITNFNNVKSLNIRLKYKNFRRLVLCFFLMCFVYNLGDFRHKIKSPLFNFVTFKSRKLFLIRSFLFFFRI